MQRCAFSDCRRVATIRDGKALCDLCRLRLCCYSANCLNEGAYYLAQADNKIPSYALYCMDCMLMYTKTKFRTTCTSSIGCTLPIVRRGLCVEHFKVNIYIYVANYVINFLQNISFVLIINVNYASIVYGATNIFSLILPI